MILDPLPVLSLVADHIPLLVLVMMGAALLEAAFGLGAFVPGETVIVLGAATIATGAGEWILPAVLLVALAACAGDHVGWWIGRRGGPAVARSPVVRRIGTGHWERALEATSRQRLLTFVVLRQLPGVRTLMSAACGAARVPYSRFLVASSIGALIWSCLWVVGGAVIGRHVVELLGPWLLALLPAWILALVLAGAVRRGRTMTRGLR